MNIKDKHVLDLINIFIKTDRLNKSQILQIIDLLPVSADIKDLKDNLRWESKNH